MTSARILQVPVAISVWDDGFGISVASLGDLDGDGHGEVISGSRYYGHDGRDVGESAPLRVSTWTFDIPNRVWKQRLLSRNYGVALGVDPKLADLDADGDPDLICADRSGLSVLLNPRFSAAAAAVGTDASRIRPAVQLTSDQLTADSQQYDHTNPQVVFRGQLQPIETAADAGLRREHTLAGMSLAMGPLPSSEQRCPLDLQILSEEVTGRYRRQRVSFQAEPGDRVPAWLLLPGTEALADAAPARALASNLLGGSRLLPLHDRSLPSCRRGIPGSFGTESGPRLHRPVLRRS